MSDLRALTTLPGPPAADEEIDALRHQCNEPFDELAHAHLLHELWEAATLPAASFARRSGRWMALGFQGDDPTRDLRGAGAHGLRQLVRFCRAGGAGVVRQVVRTEVAGRFPLAAASLNVTQLVSAHFGLLEARVGGCGDATRCSVRSVRCMLRLSRALGGGGSTCVLDLVHEQLLRHMFDRWLEVHGGVGSPSGAALLGFPALLEETRAHLRRSVALAPTPWAVGGEASVFVALRGCPSLPRDGGWRLRKGTGAHPASSLGLAELLRLPTVSRALGVAVLLFGICPSAAAEA